MGKKGNSTDARLQQHTRLTKAIIHDTFKGKKIKQLRMKAACDEQNAPDLCGLTHAMNQVRISNHSWRSWQCSKTSQTCFPKVFQVSYGRVWKSAIPRFYMFFGQIEHGKWWSTVKIRGPKSVDHGHLHHSSLREPPSRRTKIGSTEHETNNVKRNLLRGVVPTCSST